MIRFPNGGVLIQHVNELQLLPRTCHTLFGDFETASHDTTKDSLNPWHNCWPIGFAFTVDADPNSYFVPWEIIKQDTTNWLWGLIDSASLWVNHHVKYDAHVLLNHTGWQLPAKLRLVCTVVLARLIDADRSYKGGYALDTLLQQWCGHEIGHYYNRLTPYLYRNGKQFNKDYGRIPIDILAEYACGDVIGNRILYQMELMNLPPECCDTSDGTPALVETEIELTRTLLDVERTGLTIDPKDVLLAEWYCLRRMLDIEGVIAEKLGYNINPLSGDDLHDLICNRFGQPVLAWTQLDKDGKETEKSNPSFAAKVLKAYRQSFATPNELKDIIKLILSYKKEAQRRSLFFHPWQELHVNGTLHTSFQQNVRSGRMAASRPNGQQFDTVAKAKVIAKPGWVILAHDYSQVEYRVIIHYTRNPQAINAYANDPDTDYHVWVSVLCRIDRKPAKTMNFLMAFGGGKKKAIATLAANYNDQINEAISKGQDVVRLSPAELMRLGEEIYNTYHANLPELKHTTGVAQGRARQFGYVRNIAGRRLHLPGLNHNHWIGKDGKPIDRCHIAFNRAVQSSASDIAKERAVAITKEQWFIDEGCQLILLVHDAFYFQCPDRPDAELIVLNNRIRAFLEDTPFKLAVALRVDSGYSRFNMADTDKARYCRTDLPRDRCAGGKHSRDNGDLEYAVQTQRQEQTKLPNATEPTQAQGAMYLVR